MSEVTTWTEVVCSCICAIHSFCCPFFFFFSSFYNLFFPSLLSLFCSATPPPPPPPRFRFFLFFSFFFSNCRLLMSRQKSPNLKSPDPNCGTSEHDTALGREAHTATVMPPSPPFFFFLSPPPPLRPPPRPLSQARDQKSDGKKQERT